MYHQNTHPEDKVIRDSDINSKGILKKNSEVK